MGRTPLRNKKGCCLIWFVINDARVHYILATGFSAYVALAKAFFIKGLQLSISLRHVVIEGVVHGAWITVTGARLEASIEHDGRC